MQKEGAKNPERERIETLRLEKMEIQRGEQRLREEIKIQREGNRDQRGKDKRPRAGKWGQRWMQRWQSLVGNEVRVSVRSAAVQDQPGVLVPRVSGYK